MYSTENRDPMYNRDTNCPDSNTIKAELASFAITAGVGTLGTYLFTTVNPVAGFVFGATYYLVSLAVRSIAAKIFGDLTPGGKALSDLIAIGPAIGIACGVLLAASVVISPATMAIVAISTLVAYVLVRLAIWAVDKYGCAGLAGTGLCCCALFSAAAANRAAARA